MCWIVIILNQSLAHFGCGGPDNRVEIYIIFRLAPERLDSNCSLFQISAAPEKRLFDDVLQQHRISLAMREEWMCQQPVELIPNCDGFKRAIRP
jgi:hypothetical protein